MNYGGLIMNRQKYAIRFPEIRLTEPSVTADLFSEQALQETEEIFLKTFDLMHSLADYVIQKNRTRELKKQLDAQRKSLDAQVAQAAEEGQITLVEYSKRLKIQLEEKKSQLELEMKALVEETNQQVRDCSLTVEESFKTNRIWMSLIQHERETLDSFQPYLNSLKMDYANRKEYSQYCDMERKAYERIRDYLNHMI